MELTDSIRYLAALFMVLALVGAAAIAVKKYGLTGVVGGQSRRLKVLETLMLGGKHRVVLIRCDAAEHLVAITPQGATLIQSHVSGAQVAPRDALSASAPEAT